MKNDKLRFEYFIDNPLSICIEYDGGNSRDFLACLRKKKLTVVIVGTSCAGKSILLKDLVPEYDGKSISDEENFSMGITTSNGNAEQWKKAGVTDIIIKNRNPVFVAKCLNEQRDVWEKEAVKKTIWTPKKVWEWNKHILEEVKKLGIRTIHVNDDG